jgi:hypothetical protein
MEPEAVVAIIEMLITEMNVKFMTDLGDVCGDVNSDSEHPDKYADLKFIFVGGSHADRMAAAADRQGIENVNLGMPGFRVRDETIETAVCLLQDARLDNTHRNVVVYQLLDNNVFFESREDGSRALPSKWSEDNCYHIKGKLEYADHAVVKNLVNSITPLLRAGGDNEKLILSPLPRYTKRCCKDKTHLTNKRDEDYASKMGESLSDIRDSMKDLVFGKKIRSFKVLLTTKLVMGGEDDDAADNIRRFWKDDAVHMTAEGYDTLVSALAELATTATYKRPATNKNGGGSGGGNNTEGGGNSGNSRGMKRKRWVSEDDTLAHRNYDNERGRGRARGFPPTRGNVRSGGVRGDGGGGRWHRSNWGGNRFPYHKRGGGGKKY